MTHQSLPLSLHHRQILEARGLRPETIEAAGLWTVTSAATAAKMLGWDCGALLPALGIPYFGDSDYVRLRPDHPRLGEHDRVIKYEGPVGRPAMLYVPPAPALLNDVTKPVLLTEGEFKTLSMWQHEYAVVGAPGIFLFHEHKWRLRDQLLAIPLKGRVAIIVFDSDALANPNVLLAEARLASMLTEAGAEARIARVPSGPGGAKSGVDDYLALAGEDAGQVLAELLAGAISAEPAARVAVLASTAKPERPREVERLLSDRTFLAAYHVAGEVTRDLLAEELKRLGGVRRASIEKAVQRFRHELAAEAGGRAKTTKDGKPPAEYEIVDRRTYRCDGDEKVLVAECAVQINEVLTVHEGTGVSGTRFRVSVEAPTVERHVVDIEPAVFEDQRRIVPALEAATGRVLRVRPSQERNLIDAAHVLSEPKQRQVYAHTGNVVLADGRRAYLLPGGSVSADGPVDVAVEVDGAELRHYGFPPGPAEPMAAVGAVLDLLHAGAHDVTVPLLAQTLAPPLVPFMGRRRPFVHFVAPTGAFKTAGMVQLRRVWGPGPDVPLTSWNSTPNALEKLSFEAKDAPLMVDDYKSSMVPEYVWLRFIQAVGDSTGRGRMTRNLKVAPSFYPRGLILSAGEEVPGQQRSALGRLLIVRAGPGWISPESLTRVQADPRLSMVGRVWVEWICRSWEWLAKTAESEIVKWREKFAQVLGGAHARTPDGLAVLAFAMKSFFSMAQSITSIDYDGLMSMVFESLVTVGKQTASLTTEAAPGRLFVEVLAAMLRGDEVSLQPILLSKTGSWINLGGPNIRILLRTDSAALSACVLRRKKVEMSHGV